MCKIYGKIATNICLVATAHHTFCLYCCCCDYFKDWKLGAFRGFPRVIRTGWIGIYIGLSPTLSSVVYPNPHSETACKDEVCDFPPIMWLSAHVLCVFTYLHERNVFSFFLRLEKSLSCHLSPFLYTHQPHLFALLL